MRRDLCLMAALCLLVSLLAVVMATEGKTGPGPLAEAMATEKNVIQGPLPPIENDKRLSSPKLGSEYGQRATGSNSTYTAAGKGHIHVLLSSADQGRHVLKPSSEMNTSSIAASPYDPDQDHSSGRLLVAVARTLVTTTASTTTVTVLSTCHNAAIPALVCTGRKKRNGALFILANSKTGLDSSIESGPVHFDKPLERAGRLILWNSSTTTVLITTTTTNGATIVTASFSCSFPGIMMCAG